MKLITAFIQPESLTSVKQALYEKEVYKMSITNVLGCGQQKGYKEYQGSTYDEETREAREAAGTIDFTGEYMREDMERDMEEESGFDEEADALYMGNIMEDDDNDEGGEYTLDPVDNE